MLRCNLRPKVSNLRCPGPPLEAVPKGGWHCKDCRQLQAYLDIEQAQRTSASAAKRCCRRVSLTQPNPGIIVHSTLATMCLLPRPALALPAIARLPAPAAALLPLPGRTSRPCSSAVAPARTATSKHAPMMPGSRHPPLRRCPAGHAPAAALEGTARPPCWPMPGGGPIGWAAHWACLPPGRLLPALCLQSLHEDRHQGAPSLEEWS